ncbi:MAG TPA: phosphate ABC transporter ATP-binding protein [Chloroflexota bacterium]|nr:phosphate ABC transporter ATP-binding protein [Chloroflexota bacterium]
MNQPLYQLENVQQWYDGRCVLNIAQLNIQRGEILAIVGPSGAGKSTLLRLLNFLERPAQGQLTFDGQAVTPNLPLAQRRRVTMVFQRPVLLRRSVTNNLAFGLGLRGQKLPPEVESGWLERLGLATLARQSAHKLSAGEAQRVALARALVTQPDVLLLDEPTANLDPHNVGIIETILRQENQNLGMTMVLVTHNIFQAQRLAQRTALLWDGRLIEISDTPTFFNTPTQAETAAFVRGELVY